MNGSAASGCDQNTDPGELSLDDSALDREADARTRTGDPFITSEVLYQLSYVGQGRSEG